MTETKVGTHSFLREDDGKKTKAVYLSLNPSQKMMDLCSKAEECGVPPVLAIEEKDGKPVRISEWLEGKDLWELRNDWTDKMFIEWGLHMAQLHNAGVSVWDLFPKNIVWTGSRCACIDKNKFYESNFPEYDILKDVILNYGIAEPLKQAFIFGYGIERTLNFRELLDKLIDLVHDSYQDITLNGQLIKKLARSNKKIEFVREEDIKGKKVYDLGCSVGELTRSLKRFNPNQVFGFDMRYRDRYHLSILSRLLAYLEKLDECYFYPFDIEHTYFNMRHGSFPVDTVFFCALIGHIKGDRTKFMAYLDSMAKNVLYYETNLGGNEVDAMSWLCRTTTFKNFEYLGDTSDKDRGHKGYHFFRCSR